MSRTEQIIESLQLVQHPEGGFYKEVYRSEEIIQKAHLPSRFNGDRSFCTSIYFLLTSDDISAFHRIKQDEIWHFYSGSPLTIHVIDEKGNYSHKTISNKLNQTEFPMATVKAGCYFGATVDEPDTYALVGCTVAPGFDFEDFQMPKRSTLLEKYPQHTKTIEKLTRE